MDRATAFYKSGPWQGNLSSVSSQIRGNLKREEAIVKFPVAVWAKCDQVFQRVDLAYRGSRRKGRDRSYVAYLKMLIVPTDGAALRSVRDQVFCSR